jgi:tetratricopeptide (TPR) repeat protein
VLEHRPNESSALLREALRIALEHDLTAPALRAYNNMTVIAQLQDRFDEYLHTAEDGVALARRRGDRSWEWNLTCVLVEYQVITGEWDTALAMAAEMPQEPHTLGHGYFPAEFLTFVHVERGELAEARALHASFADRERSPDLQEREYALLAAATLHRLEGRPAEAAAAAEEADHIGEVVPLHRAQAGAELCEAAFALGDIDRVEQVLVKWAALKPAARPLSLQAHEARIAARLAALRGDGPLAEGSFTAAAARFRELGMPFWLAVSLLEHGEWLVAEGRGLEAEPLLDEAREIFERLKARPWLERLERVRPPAEVTA